MPQYQIDIQKVLGTEYWTNVYHVSAASLTAARDIMFDIVDEEKKIHHTNVSFDRYRVALMPVSGGSFLTGGLSGPGLATGPADVPLFAVARVEFSTGFGRPGIKMYRGCLTEGDIVDTTALSSGIQTYFNGTWIPGLLAAAPLEKINGTGFVGGSLSPTVGMRQLRRGSRRRTEPVI
jgi:hypothetical protein